MNDKARHGAGSSRGGQFATTRMDEVEVNLGDSAGPGIGVGFDSDQDRPDKDTSTSATGTMTTDENGLLRPGDDALSLPSFADHGYASWPARDAAQAAAADFAVARFDHQAAAGRTDDSDLRALAPVERESLKRAARAAYSAQSQTAVNAHVSAGRARRDQRLAEESYGRALSRVRGPFGKKAFTSAHADLDSAVGQTKDAERTHRVSLETLNKTESLLTDLARVEREAAQKTQTSPTTKATETTETSTP